jgi:membrane protease YdiL (CAAX protease family)
MLSAQPVISLLNEWNSRMILPESLSGLENWMKSSETQAQKITEAFLSTSSWSGFLVNTFMIALLPAFSEELLFRGILARLLRDWTRNIHIGVILSALVFAGIHLQFYGFLPRFMLGIALVTSFSVPAPCGFPLLPILSTISFLSLSSSFIVKDLSL